MQTFLRAAALGFLALTLVAVESRAQGTDPVIGTWELNVAKSKFSPGPPTKSETRTYVVEGQDIKATAKGVDGAGKPFAAGWTVNYDGKSRPQTGNPDADALSVKRVDPLVAEFSATRAGKVVITGSRTISKDGKVMTIATKGTDAQGRTVNNLEVFEKK